MQSKQAASPQPQFDVGSRPIYNSNMFEVGQLIDAIHAKRFKITDHADEETRADSLTFDEVLFSVLQGEIIESYPSDKPYPSCLVFGTTFMGDPVHSVWAYNEESRWAVLVTVYRPDPGRWIDWKTRRKRNETV